jgi:hypothetical protein
MVLLDMLKGNALVEIEGRVKKSFSAVREEMEDHLVAINENTDELKNHADCMNEIDKKIELLNEKVESLHLTLMQVMGSSLNENEKKILHVLDTSLTFLSCKDIALSANVSELFVKAHLFSIICKGVPLKEKVIETQSYFALESAKKKENLEICTVRNHQLAEF